MVNCYNLIHVINRLLSRSPSRYDPLYRHLLKKLKAGNADGIIRFEITGGGYDTKRKREQRTRIRVEIPELKCELELPDTFLHTCRESFR